MPIQSGAINGMLCLDKLTQRARNCWCTTVTRVTILAAHSCVLVQSA